MSDDLLTARDKGIPDRAVGMTTAALDSSPWGEVWGQDSAVAVLQAAASDPASDPGGIDAGVPTQPLTRADLRESVSV